MSKRSRFFSAMSCFLTNDQNGKQSKKKSPALKNTSKRKHDVLAINEITSNPKHHLQQINTVKPGIIAETIDLTKDEENSIFPIKIQILDGLNNIEPFSIFIKTDSQENTNISFNCFTNNQVTSPEKCIKNEPTTTDNTVIIFKDENITNDSISIDGMSIDKQIEPLKNDVPLLNQHRNCDNHDLSRNENEEISRINDGTDETEAKSVECLPKIKRKTGENSAAFELRKKIAKKATKPKNKLETFLDSKLVTLKDGTYYCTFCEVSFKYKRTIISHVKSHKMTKFEYKCSVCDERFHWKRSLIRHLKEHFVLSDFEQNTESEQIKEKSKSESEPTPIFLLNKTTADDHETFNNLEKKLKSNNNSTHASLIKVIYDTDRTELNLACIYCDQCFDSQISLVEHCRTHMADRPFICNVCGTLFKQNAALVYHTRTHFRMMRKRKKRFSAPYIRYMLRLHSCKDCDRSYVSWSALNQHRVEVHGATQDDFACDICQQVFNTSRRLRSHKYRKMCKRKSQLPKERVSCEVCAKTFCNKYILKKHILKLHQKN